MYTSDWLKDGESAPDWLMRETSLNILIGIMIIYFQTINQAYFSRSKSLQIFEKIFKKSAFNGNLQLNS